MGLPPGIDPAEEERRRQAAGEGGGLSDLAEGVGETVEAASGCLDIGDGCAGCSIDLIALTAIAGLGILLMR